MEFRIVRDAYAGYEVQMRRWWFPFWVQCGGINTHRTVEEAEAFAAEFSVKGKIVKHLGKMHSN